jgi:UDP-N-acetylmuramoyl-L-alanyl-D-glutamate--2,6-diaminopimelate ligase
LKKLVDILFGVKVLQTIGSIEQSVRSITFDSRKVELHTLFIAQKGTLTDGHLYIDKAIELGATVIVCETLTDVLKPNKTYVQVADANEALSFIAANFYDNPSHQLKLVGITGTNGKTTLATLSHALFQKAGFHCGLISTVVIKVGNKEYPTSHTTPDSITINHYLSQMVAEGVSHCFMEISSHGIHQKRTASLYFTGGVFTNLTHDHLDYHSTFAEYRDVKKSFFDLLPKTAFAITNLDDKNGKVMLQNTLATKKTYALKTMADYKAKVLENRLEGLYLQIDGQDVYTKLIGNFNAYNLLAIYAIARELGLDKMETLMHLSELESVNGRFQYFISNQGVTTIVDYAHTPDALINVLQTINEIRTGNENLITVVGCGGDRDKTKRPKMGQIAAQLSSTAVFTSDNPRSEDPQVIIEEMEKGVSAEYTRKTLSILDRKEAIKTASKLSKKGDIVLIAGKGHETYQEIKGVKYDFDDLKIAKELFNY